MTDFDLLKVIRAITEQSEADGCKLCAFGEKEEWEMPCVKCKRACRDYWRRKKDE